MDFYICREPLFISVHSSEKHRMSQKPKTLKTLQTNTHANKEKSSNAHNKNAVQVVQYNKYRKWSDVGYHGVSISMNHKPTLSIFACFILHIACVGSHFFVTCFVYLPAFSLAAVCRALRANVQKSSVTVLFSWDLLQVLLQHFHINLKLYRCRAQRRDGDLKKMLQHSLTEGKWM